MMRARLTIATLTVSTLALAAAAGSIGAPAASGVAPGPGARADDPSVPYRVTLNSSTKEAVAHEDKVRLSGAVYPTPPQGSQVLVQARYEDQSGWRKAGVAQVKKDGTYAFVDKPSTTRDRAYRVVKRSDAVGTQDKSRERSVHVIGWSWLGSLTPSAQANVYNASSMPINGDDYAHTLFVDRTFTSGFTEYTLGRNCYSLEATYGLSDRTETGGRGSIALAADGVTAYARTFDLGQSELVTQDVTGVYRARIDFSQVSGTPVTEPSAGAARVLCD